jgi:ADP-ribose pyrophosphatase YjhB (NUDIX family)
LEETENHQGVIYMSANADASWKIFISYCELSEAAGGLVMNEEGDYLIILRHGKWDLPKGKLEYDGSPEEGALREVKEECGIEKLELVKPLEKTFHTYHLKRKRMLKKTHWFLMKSGTDELLIPQKEEDIQEVRWMTKEKIRKKVYANTYNSIRELLEHFI